jgi:hypothetical protein
LTTLGDTQPATVLKLGNKLEGMPEMSQNRSDFSPAENRGDIVRLLRAADVFKVILKLAAPMAQTENRPTLRKPCEIRDKGAGDKRFTSRVLYERFGLYRVSTTAGWTKAHALR